MHIIYVTGMRYVFLFFLKWWICAILLFLSSKMHFQISMHYNSFWEKISFLSRALKQKAIHGQECYQTLNSGCNRHLMADVALPNHFCFSKEIKNIKDYKYKSNYKCKTKNLTTLRKLSSKNLTYNCCYSRDYGISQA